MSDTKTDGLTFEELTQPCEPSAEEKYLEWKEQKIKKALDAAKANPEKLVSHVEMRARLDLEH